MERNQQKVIVIIIQELIQSGGNDIYGSAHKNGSTGPDKKFYNNSWWWIASPSAERNFGVCGISGNDSGVSNRGTYDCNRLSLFAVVGV